MREREYSISESDDVDRRYLETIFPHLTSRTPCRFLSLDPSLSIMSLIKYAHSFAKILGIELVEQLRFREVEESLSRVLPHPYYEPEPTVSEYLQTLVPTRRDISTYIHDLFPSAQWLPRYNWRWLLGDAIAGLTIGFVVVPQAMAYALLAQLSPEFGLYTSFAGAATYFLFGTSKDIVIGVSINNAKRVLN
jgi:hypothetical protein